MLVDSVVQHAKSKLILPSKGQDLEEDEEIEEDEDYEPLDEPMREPAYPYQPLGETDIRLLRIVPGTGDVECLLHQMPLAEVRFFYALSYVWGDMMDKKTIILEGKPFQVTKNLYEALHQFRERPHDLGYPEDYFWIDAICINQQDIDERSKQVSRMVEIYHVGHVVVWLGPVQDSPPGSLFRKTIRKVRSSQSEISSDQAIKTLFKKANSMWTEWDPVDDDDNIIIEDEFGDSYDAVVYAAVDILQRPWFQRVWTIQEACLNTYPNVYVGRHSVRLENFVKLFKILATQQKFLYIPPGSARIIYLDKINQLYQQTIFDGDENPKKLGTANVLAMLLRVTGQKISSDPRDQLYGLLGLLKHLDGDELPKELAPDYHLPHDIVYWNYAAFLFESLGDLKLLDCRRNELQNVPSWVPDFRHFSLGPEFRTEPTVRVSSDRKTLQLRGCVLGTFHSAIPGRALTDIMPNAKKIPRQLSNHLEEFEKRILTPSATIRKMTVEDVVDEMMKSATRIISEGTVSFYHVFQHLKESTREKRSRSAGKKRTTNVRWKEEAIAGQFTSPFIYLADGTILRVARDDADVKDGDMVCIFKGAWEPSLVRATGDNYIFLGRCVAKGGPLKGQKFDDDFWADKEMQDFNLI
ncbi:HET-domain-containing protein [Annulohypoxylon truncatum]|uniref:HET-domain-containing protein n=1 Tax=Annulohypoxylon truncatum TaxID=327061 RepID=UPI002007700B|nr:HET-domain-containing protein [Annulohypoxylon truncatum]KAI1210889.1 HET-domain-containing protein [Annulohypoxylon truncatum]